MKLYVSALLALLVLAGCQRSVLKEDPLLYSFMPDSMTAIKPLLDTVKTLPPDISKYDDFKSIAISGAAAYICDDDNCNAKTNLTLPAGTLVSDRTVFELAYSRIAIQNVNQRLIVAQDLFEKYNAQIKTAEKLYDKRLQQLDKASQRSWFEKNAAYFGFVAGIVVTILLESVTVQITK
jgi:hypothetical protein